MARPELGAMLRQADLVSEAQLQEALSLQRVHGERLASVLVRQNILTEKFAVTYLGRQLGVPPVDLSRFEIDLALLDFVPLDLCDRHLIFPVRIDGTRLLLAMSDPLDHKLVAEVEFKTGVRLAPAIALEASIKNAVLEARRATRAGLKRITPQIQKLPREAAAGPPVPARSDRGPAEALEHRPLPVQPIDDTRARALFETLGGAPLHPVAPPAPAPPPRPPAVEETQTVLVVDDDENILRLLEALLQSRRYRVVSAKDGREALARVKESMPDLVILDGMLPGVHGFEICRQLKNSERFRHVPVLMMSAVHTGWRFAADVKERYGADDYLEKPFEGADLLRRVEHLLNRSPGGPAPAAEVAARQELKVGVIALKQERVDDAITALERGLAIDGFNDLLHYYLAMAFEKKDMAFHAIDHYERAIQVNPDFYDAITAVARLYEKQEFRRKAAEMWELALRTTRDEPVREQIKAHLMTLL